MGRRLSEACNNKVTETVNFINDQIVDLSRDLKDLNDVRLAMKSLDAIRDKSIEYVFCSIELKLLYNGFIYLIC